MVKISLFQSCTGLSMKTNAQRLVEAIEDSAQAGARMVFTPEMSGLLDGNRERAARAVFTEADDPVLMAVRDAAERRKIWVHLGSLALKGPGKKLVNRGFVIDNNGEIRGRYDKIHLFDVDLPTGEKWRESAMYAAGCQPVVVSGTPVGNLGLSICYDLRFPALFERLSEAGADVIAVPAAFTVPTGKAHWHILLRARAIEASVFVVAAAQSGNHEDGRSTFGHSLVVDPWGETVLDAAKADGVHFAELDLKLIGEVRSRIPVLDHRRVIGPVAN